MNEFFETFKEKLKDLFGSIRNIFARQTQKFVKIFIIVGSLIIIVLIIVFIIKGIKLKNCTELYNQVDEKIRFYMLENKLYPNVDGEYVIVNMNDLSKVTFNEKTCSGEVKVTKYKDEYINTYYINDCGYCSTKPFGGERDTYDSKKNNVDVITYYNYYEVTYNNTSWSKWIPFEEISTEATDGVLLPINLAQLPKVSEEAIVIETVKEDKNYYKFRDKLWKWYRVPNNNYSGFSSTQPSGYPNKDTNTQISSEFTEWDLNYPESYDYRSIQTQTGYRWYKKDENNNKVWWNSGKYYPSRPEEGYIQDDSSNVKMYRYSDKMWKWYNGEKRQYSTSYTANPPSKAYVYKDTDLTNYTSWSNFKEQSSINAANSSYREEIINVHSRYMIKFKMKTFLKLDKHLPKQEFEQLMNKTVLELLEDKSVEVDMIFKFRY